MNGATSSVTSRVTCRGTQMRSVGEVVDDEPARGGVVDDKWRDEPRDEPRDMPKHPDARRRRSSRRRVCARRSSRRRAMSRATCRGTQTRDVGEVVDDEPARGGVVDDERCDEPRDKPCDVLRHPDARRSRSCRRRACARRSSRRRAMSCATCRGTQTRGVAEVVDDEPARRGVVDDERCDEPRDEPRDVPRHPDARRR
jgi:hypothetical protein